MRLQPIKPSKKKNGYLIKLYDKDTKAVPRVRVMDVKLSFQSGREARVWMASTNTGKERVQECDKQALKLMSQHNQHWFQNSLTQEKILEFYRYSFDTHGFIAVQMSETNPCKCYHNAKTCAFESIENALSASSSSIGITVVMVPMALYVTSSTFYIMWYLSEIHVTEEGFEDDGEVIDKEGIEDAWKEEVAAAHTSLDQKMDLLMKKYTHLQAYKKELDDLMEVAQSQTSTSKLWDLTLENLETKIRGVKTGQLWV